VGDLDQFPHKETTSADVYAEAANYKAVLGKLYVSFVTAIFFIVFSALMMT